MTFRPSITLGACVLALAVVSGCGSDDSSNDSGAADTAATAGESDPAADSTTAPVDSAPAGGTDTGTEVDDLCAVVPDAATIEAAIGVAVKDPLGIGEPGTLQSCTMSRAADDFPGITFTLNPGGTIAAQIDYAKTTFQIDIVPLEGEDGFYAGEGDSVYHEANGNLYQTSASIDGDSRAASLNLMKAWLGL